jgi:hypothetical protein
MSNKATERTADVCEGVEMTPTQINDVIEGNLTNLGLAMENVYSEMVRLKEDLLNGKFDAKKIFDRAMERLRAS